MCGNAPFLVGSGGKTAEGVLTRKCVFFARVTYAHSSPLPPPRFSAFFSSSPAQEVFRTHETRRRPGEGKKLRNLFVFIAGSFFFHHLRTCKVGKDRGPFSLPRRHAFFSLCLRDYEDTAAAVMTGPDLWDPFFGGGGKISGISFPNPETFFPTRRCLFHASPTRLEKNCEFSRISPIHPPFMNEAPRKTSLKYLFCDLK